MVKKSRKVVESNSSFSDDVDLVRLDLLNGKITRAEADRRLRKINDEILAGADSYDPEFMGEEGDDMDMEEIIKPEEIGEVEVEKVLDPETLPIEHADEPIEMLDVFVVHNSNLSDKEFYAVVDIADNDADTGITFAQLTESEEVDHEATNELVQRVVDTLEQRGFDVVNLNDAGIAADDTEGSAEVAAELALGEDDEAEQLDEPVEGGFAVMGNPDGSVTVLGADVDTLLDVTFHDAKEDVVAELSELPVVSDETKQVLESRKCAIKESMRKLIEATEEEVKATMAEYLGVPEDEVEVRMEEGYGVDYANVEADGAEYVVFDNWEDAEYYAKKRVEDDLYNEPSLFSEDFLMHHIYISDMDKRIMASEDADAQVENMSDEEVVERAGLDSEYSEAEDADDTDEMESIVARARENVSEEIAGSLEVEYDDPINYFQSNFGYSIEGILALPFIQIDYADAARDVIVSSGAEMVLATYDHAVIELPNSDMVAFRTN